MTLGKKLFIMAALCSFGAVGFAASSSDVNHDEMRPSSVEQNGAKRALKHESCEDIKGEILEIRRIMYPNGEQTHIKLKDEAGHELFIVLGPSRVVNSGYLNLKEGNTVEIEAYEVVSDKGSMWVATRIQKGACWIELDKGAQGYGQNRAVHGHDPCCAPGYYNGDRRHHRSGWY
jgi:hypothetical protein